MTRRENQSVVFANRNKNLLPVDLPSHTVANVPDPANNESRIIFVSNGAAGQPVLAWSDGTTWNRSDTLQPITAV